MYVCRHGVCILSVKILWISEYCKYVFTLSNTTCSAQEDKTDKQSVSDDLKKMETEVNAGSYYKEAGAGKSAESKRTNGDVVAIGSPKNVPSPTSSHRDKLKVDGILPNKRVRQIISALSLALKT